MVILWEGKTDQFANIQGKIKMIIKGRVLQICDLVYIWTQYVPQFPNLTVKFNFYRLWWSIIILWCASLPLLHWWIPRKQKSKIHFTIQIIVNWKAVDWLRSSIIGQVPNFFICIHRTNAVNKEQIHNNKFVQKMYK